MKQFKQFVTTTALMVVSASSLLAATEVYNVDKVHSAATFQVRHLMSKVSGKFNDFSGVINVDQAKPTASTVEFTMKTASVDTGEADRDKDLRSANFFDADKYPEITFKSKSIQPTKTKNLYDVTGTLTMRGVSKTVTLPVEFLGFARDPWGNDKAGFETHTRLNRKDYGINWNKALDNGGVLVGDDVDVSINIEAAKAKPAAAAAASSK